MSHKIVSSEAAIAIIQDDDDGTNADVAIGIGVWFVLALIFWAVLT